VSLLSQGEPGLERAALQAMCFSVGQA